MEKTIKESTKVKVNKDEVKANENDNAKVFDLENVEDFEEILDEVSKSKYFTLEEDITYKVTLVSSKINMVESEFENNGKKTISIKYAMGISVKGSDDSKFDGIWEAPISVMKKIMKSFKDKKFEKGAVFNVSKTGKGLNTQYSVSKDF